MKDSFKDETITFSIKKDEEKMMREILSDVYSALLEKGYHAIDQIVGYILSEDPTYITNYNNARAKIRKIDRDDLLKVLVQNYLNSKDNRE